MTNIPTTQPDDATKVIAVQDDDLVTVNLPSPPLTPEERETEFRSLLDELLATDTGKELFALAIEARRTYVKVIGDIDEAQFWNYFFAGVLQNRERTNALGTALGLDNYATLPDLSKLRASVPEPVLKEFSRGLEKVVGESEEWQFLNPFPENVSDMIFATLIGEREFDSNNPNEIDFPPLTRIGGEDGIMVMRDGGDVSVNDIPADHKIFYENGDHPQNYQFCGRKSQLSGIALNVYGSAFRGFPSSMLIHFDYALLRALDDDETIDMLKFGDKAAIIGLNRTQGLFLNIGNTLSATTTDIFAGASLLPTDSVFPFYCIGRSGADSLDRLYFYVPPEVEGTPTVFVTVSFIDEGHRVTLDFKQYRPTVDGSDEVLENRAIFSDGTNPDLLLKVRYIGDHNGHHAIHLEPTRGVSTDITYKIQVSYYASQTVNEPMGHFASSLHVANNAATRVFDPRLDCELQRRTGNTVMVELKEGSNGYMQARVTVNGMAEYNGAFIDIQRTGADIGLQDLSRDEPGGGMTIGNDAVRLSRVYVIGNGKPLTITQTRQIYGNIETPGTIYYARRALNPTYKLDAQLQVRDGDGEYFTVGRPADAGVSLVLDENGFAKNFLTSPIISTDTESQANSAVIPELVDAKIIAVICAYEGEPYSSESPYPPENYYTRESPLERIPNLYKNEAMTLIYKTDYPYYHGADVYYRNVVVGGHGVGRGQRYYIRIYNDRIYLENVRNTGGNPGIYAVHIYK